MKISGNLQTASWLQEAINLSVEMRPQFLPSCIADTKFPNLVHSPFEIVSECSLQFFQIAVFTLNQEVKEGGIKNVFWRKSTNKCVLKKEYK